MNRAARRRLVNNSVTGRPVVLTAGPMMKAPDSKYNASIPSVEPGEHLWVVMSMYRIHHPERMATETWHLDLENLISADGPICYLCEEPYRDGIESCGGDKYPYENTQR